MNRTVRIACGTAAAVLMVGFAGCVTAPKTPPKPLNITCRPEATVQVRGRLLAKPLDLGRTPVVNVTTVRVSNTALPEHLRKGDATLSTVVRLDQLAPFEAELRAADAPDLYAIRTCACTSGVAPWTFTVDLGLPARQLQSEKMGLEFAIPSLPGCALKLMDRQYPLPVRLDLPEGEYVFQLTDPKGRNFSGLMKLENSKDDFVRFAYVPVFQQVTATELGEIADRKREPRMFKTLVSDNTVPLATVWIGSRSSAEGVYLGERQVRNIEAVFNRADAELSLNAKPVGRRFYIDARGKTSEHYLTIHLPKPPGRATPVIVYGTLTAPEIDQMDTTLTSFEITLTDTDIQDIMDKHTVIKKYGVYQCSEQGGKEIQMYELTLGEKKPKEMELLEAAAAPAAKP